LTSYGKVSFKRFIDTVPMICIEIMQNFTEKMNDVLFDVTDADWTVSFLLLKPH